MTQVLFELPSDKVAKLASRHESLKKDGMVRAHMIIPSWYNNLMKAEARSMGKNADVHLGEVHMRHCVAVVDKLAQEHAKRLRAELGPEWLELLKKAQDSSPSQP